MEHVSYVVTFDVQIPQVVGLDIGVVQSNVEPDQIKQKL